ncbi:MAG: hypothetical protein EZS28_035101, partial [Streblomastix strix]
VRWGVGGCFCDIDLGIRFSFDSGLQLRPAVILSESIVSICEVLGPITVSVIDWYIWGCMLMNPATPSPIFSNPGMYDPLCKIRPSFEVVGQSKKKGDYVLHTSTSNQFHYSSERFRSLGLGIGIGRQFLGGQKKVGRSLFGYEWFRPGATSIILFNKNY